jgi:anti-anti-sigma factor
MTSANNNPLHTDCPTDDDAVVVRLAESSYASLDTARLGSARRLLLREAEMLEPKDLVVDLTAVQFFGASFAGLLVATWDALRRRNRRLVLSGLTPYCAGLIKKLSLDRLFAILPAQQDAVEKPAHRAAIGDRMRRVPGVRIEKTDVAWDSRMQRWEYIDGDGCPIKTIIIPRPE